MARCTHILNPPLSHSRGRWGGSTGPGPPGSHLFLNFLTTKRAGPLVTASTSTRRSSFFSLHAVVQNFAAVSILISGTLSRPGGGGRVLLGLVGSEPQAGTEERPPSPPSTPPLRPTHKHDLAATPGHLAPRLCPNSGRLSATRLRL